MAVRLRLKRVGRKSQPSYRIVAADSESPRDGRFIEALGHYWPRARDKQFDLDVEKAKAWLAKGATPSETVASILKKAGIRRD
ncbi:MAG TPA: 30S ribosomal protein S16 [Gemmatimonadales bacterium]|nr:30S ribosomal protein S16 [Gemmatimonadales bacterium]